MYPTYTFQLTHFRTKILLCFFLASTFISCGDGARDIHNFYFPLKKLKTAPKVYVYNYSTNKGENLFKTYWYYQTIVQGDSIWFVGTLYDSTYNAQLIAREKRYENCMVLTALQFFGHDSLNKLLTKEATIINPASFPFTLTKNKGIFVSSMEYDDLADSLKSTTITRNRRYLKDTIVNFEGKKHDAIIFSMQEEQAEKHKKHGDWSHVYNIKEVYAENIGLFETNREIMPGAQFIGKLERIITMEGFEKEFKIKNRE